MYKPMFSPIPNTFEESGDKFHKKLEEGICHTAMIGNKVTLVLEIVVPKFLVP